MSEGKPKRPKFVEGQFTASLRRSAKEKARAINALVAFIASDFDEAKLSERVHDELTMGYEFCSHNEKMRFHYIHFRGGEGYFGEGLGSAGRRAGGAEGNLARKLE